MLQVIQCGRHNDIFKFWLSWRSKGITWLGFIIDSSRHSVTKMELETHTIYSSRHSVTKMDLETHTIYSIRYSVTKMKLETHTIYTIQ